MKRIRLLVLIQIILLIVIITIEKKTLATDAQVDIVKQNNMRSNNKDNIK